jgi:hypothetical protein
MKNIETRSSLEQGDILVTEDRAKALSLPRDAQGRPIRPAAIKPGEAAPAAAETAPAEPEASKKPIRSVGPQFIPAR